MYTIPPGRHLPPILLECILVLRVFHSDVNCIHTQWMFFYISVLLGTNSNWCDILKIPRAHSGPVKNAMLKENYEFAFDQCKQTLTSRFSRFILYVRRFVRYLPGFHLYKRAHSCINTVCLHCSVVFFQAYANKPRFCNLYFDEKGRV